MERINPAGSVAWSPGRHEGQSDIQVDLSLDRFAELNLQLGDTVFVLREKCACLCPTMSFENSNKTVGDCPNFVKSGEEGTDRRLVGTVPFAETVLLEFLNQLQQ